MWHQIAKTDFGISAVLKALLELLLVSQHLYEILL